MNAADIKRTLHRVNEKLEDLLVKFPENLPEPYEQIEEAQKIIADTIDDLSNLEE